MTVARTSALQTLHDQLAAINTDIGVLTSPLEEVDQLLGEIEDLLEEPKKIDDDLGDIEDVLKALYKVASDADWIPEIGEDATTTAQVLNTAIVAITEIRKILSDIEKELEELSKWLALVKQPVDKVLAPIHRVELEVARYEAGTERLIQQFGPSPPTNVEACAAGLSNAVAPTVGALDSAKDKGLALLSDIENPMREAQSALARIVDYADVVQKVYADLAWLRAAVRAISKEVQKAESYGKAALNLLLKTKFPGKVYEEVMSELRQAKALLNKLEGKVTAYALSPVKSAAEKAEQAIEQEMQKLPDLKPLEDAAANLTTAFQRIEDSVANTLSKPCADLLGAGSAIGRA